MEQSLPPGQWQTSTAIPPMPPNVRPPYSQNNCCSEKFITKNTVITLFIIVALALIIYYGFVHFQSEINRMQYSTSYQGIGGLAAYHPQERIISRPPAGELASQQLNHRAKFHAFSTTTATKRMPITDLPINNRKLIIVEGAPIIASPTFSNAS